MKRGENPWLGQILSVLSVWQYLVRCTSFLWFHRTSIFQSEKLLNISSSMAIFLVDLQFREKAKQVLTSKELAAVIFFLMFAMVPWVEIMEMAKGVANTTWWEMEEEMSSQSTHCNPHTRSCLWRDWTVKYNFVYISESFCIMYNRCFRCHRW